MIDNTDSFRPVVIVPAFSRSGALRRLLASINRAHYPTNGVRLIISLDGGAPRDVVESAREFEFRSGSVEVIERDERLGLREHILWCGDRTEEHGAVIVLEDDLLVDPWFYEYAIHALAAHEQESTVAGIALYAPRQNDYAHLPFEPLENGLSGYLMQVPCSWGQAWTAGQWRAFREWYGQAGDDVVDRDASIPDAVRAWPASSWKKYFVAYLSATERYFVYPYRSYTTNCSDPGGTHVSRGSDLYQVPLPDPQRDFATPGFPAAAEHSVVYDQFMEPRIGIDFDALALTPGSVAVDLYGIKPASLLRESDYCLTTRPVEAALAGFPLSFRPLEMNIHAADGGLTDGPIRLCRSEQLQDRGPWFARMQSRYRLKWYFLSATISGLDLLLFGVVTLLRRLRDLVRP